MCNPRKTKNRGTEHTGVESRLTDSDDVIEIVSESELSEQRSARYIDNRLEAVGVGLQVGGALLYVTGLEQPIFLPNEYIDWATTTSQAENDTLYASRETALAAIRGRHGQWFAFYQVVGGMTAPTVFSSASTPRIIATLLDAQRRLAEEAAELFTALAVSLVGGVLVRLGFRVWQRSLTWTPKGGDGLRPMKFVPPPADPPVSGTGGSPDMPSRSTQGRGLTPRVAPGDDVPSPPRARGTQKRSSGSPPPARSTQKRGGAALLPGSKTTSPPKRAVPLPAETPEEYHLRTTGEHVSSLPKAVQPATVRQAAQAMQMGVIEAGLENPKMLWSHYLTKGGYGNIMRTQSLRPGPGTGDFGQGQAVRAVPGPFPARGPIQDGRIHLDFRVRDSEEKGVATMFMGQPGAKWTNPVSIKIERVGYKDGSIAQPLPNGKWRLTSPNGAKREMDRETLLQLGDTPTQGLRRP